MENILRELFGKTDDDPEVAPAATPAAGATDQDRDAAHEARRETRRQRKADPERVRKRRDFFERYTSGSPSEGFTAEEAIEHLAEMREELGPGEFQWAMVQTLDHLPPDQRDEFIALMRQSKAEADAGAARPAPTGQPPATTASTSAPVSASPGSGAGDPFGGLLTGLLGGRATSAGTGGFDVGALFDDLRRSGFSAPEPAGGGKPTRADFAALVNSPLGKAVLGGLAAYGARAAEEDDEQAPTGQRA